MRATAFIPLVVLLASCAITTPEAFYNEAPAEWTKQQKIVAFFYALQNEGTVQTPTGRAIRSDLVEVQQALYMAERMSADLKWFAGNEEYVNYLLWNGSKQSFAETEAVWEFVTKCLRAYKIQADLADLFGIKLDGLDGKYYDIRLITACPTLADRLRLLDPRTEEAINDGRLLPNQVIRVDLADPMGAITLEATTYILIPDAPQTEEEALQKYYSPGIYAEVKREGEPMPIVRLMRAPGSDILNVVILDTDPPDYFGYGLPDKMESGGYTSAIEFIAQRVRDLIPREFKTTQLTQKRFVPPPEEVHVVRSAEATYQAWEEGVFEVPIDYKDKPFYAEVRLKKKQDRQDGLKEVEYYIANYYSHDVVEYYTPNPEYALVRDYSYYGPDISLSFRDKPSIKAPPSSMGKLTYVMYRLDSKGWLLWDSDGDGVFDKRRPVVWRGAQSPSQGGDFGF